MAMNAMNAPVAAPGRAGFYPPPPMGMGMAMGGRGVKREFDDGVVELAGDGHVPLLPAPTPTHRTSVKEEDEGESLWIWGAFLSFFLSLSLSLLLKGK